MAGFEALERLKADPATQAIPVVIITSIALEKEELRLLDEMVGTLSTASAPREAAVSNVERSVAHAMLLETNKTNATEQRDVTNLVPA